MSAQNFMATHQIVIHCEPTDQMLEGNYQSQLMLTHSINLTLHFWKEICKGKRKKKKLTKQYCAITCERQLSYRRPFNQQLFISLKARVVSYRRTYSAQPYSALTGRSKAVHTLSHMSDFSKLRVCRARRAQTFLLCAKTFFSLTNIKQK